MLVHFQRYCEVLVVINSEAALDLNLVLTKLVLEKKEFPHCILISSDLF